MVNLKNFWTCPKCDEEIDDHFELCWKCQGNRQGTLMQEPPVPTDEGDEADRAFFNEKFRPRNCVQCKGRLSYVGPQRLHEGVRASALGEFTELSERHVQLEMYVCRSCLRVEFLASDLD